MPDSPTQLEETIYQTVRYWSLFDRPVTTVELWQALVVIDPKSRVRWGGLRTPRLQEIAQVLAQSTWLAVRLEQQWGYYCLAGRLSSVERCLRRHRLAQLKWKIVQRVVPWFTYVPFVRGVFGSGSLAVMNTRPSSDLDLLVVAGAGRIWTARLWLLCLAQLTGRRRRYWDRLAPDRLCLNHYVTEGSLTLPAAIHNIYTAMLYVHLVPLVGTEMYERFMAANAWIKRFVMYPEASRLPSVYAVRPRRGRVVTAFVERFLAEPVGNGLERAAERMQRWFIRKHARLRQSGGGEKRGRVALSGGELAFHPDSKVDALLAAYAQDPGQQALL